MRKWSRHTLENKCVSAVQQENSPSITNACADAQGKRIFLARQTKNTHAYAPKSALCSFWEFKAQTKNTHAHMSELRAHDRSLDDTHAHKTCMHCKCHVGGCCRMIAARK
jgi:hypothetical protein